MTTSRQRVLQSLNFRMPDRLPKDLGGMRSTSISAFAYPKLVARPRPAAAPAARRGHRADAGPARPGCARRPGL